MKNPPFEITNTIIDLVVEIAELVGKLTSIHQLSANPMLRHTNRIRTIHGSLAIEQNTLSLEQVTAVLNGKHVLAPPKDIAEVRAWDSSNNDYKNSDIHAYLNGSWLSRYSAGVLSQIKQVKTPYQNGTGSRGSVASGANGLSCKIFLLSGYEVGFTTSDDSRYPRDGAKLSYFSSGTGSAANNKRIANYNGSATRWWLRSPNTNNTNNVWNVNSNGDYNNWNANNSYGVRPALMG